MEDTTIEGKSGLLSKTVGDTISINVKIGTPFYNPNTQLRQIYMNEISEPVYNKEYQIGRSMKFELTLTRAGRYQFFLILDDKQTSKTSIIVNSLVQIKGIPMRAEQLSIFQIHASKVDDNLIQTLSHNHFNAVGLKDFLTLSVTRDRNIEMALIKPTPFLGLDEFREWAFHSTNEIGVGVIFDSDFVFFEKDSNIITHFPNAAVSLENHPELQSAFVIDQHLQIISSELIGKQKTDQASLCDYVSKYFHKNVYEELKEIMTLNPNMVEWDALPPRTTDLRNLSIQEKRDKLTQSLSETRIINYQLLSNMFSGPGDPDASIIDDCFQEMNSKLPKTMDKLIKSIANNSAYMFSKRSKEDRKKSLFPFYFNQPTENSPHFLVGNGFPNFEINYEGIMYRQLMYPKDTFVVNFDDADTCRIMIEYSKEIAKYATTGIRIFGAHCIPHDMLIQLEDSMISSNPNIIIITINNYQYHPYTWIWDSQCQNLLTLSLKPFITMPNSYPDFSYKAHQKIPLLGASTMHIGPISSSNEFLSGIKEDESQYSLLSNLRNTMNSLHLMMNDMPNLHGEDIVKGHIFSLYRYNNEGTSGYWMLIKTSHRKFILSNKISPPLPNCHHVISAHWSTRRGKFVSNTKDDNVKEINCQKLHNYSFALFSVSGQSSPISAVINEGQQCIETIIENMNLEELANAFFGFKQQIPAGIFFTCIIFKQGRSYSPATCINYLKSIPACNALGRAIEDKVNSTTSERDIYELFKNIVKIAHDKIERAYPNVNQPEAKMIFRSLMFTFYDQGQLVMASAIPRYFARRAWKVRNTLVAFRGLYLIPNRTEIAKSILTKFASAVGIWNKVPEVYKGTTPYFGKVSQSELALYFLHTLKQCNDHYGEEFQRWQFGTTSVSQLANQLIQIVESDCSTQTGFPKDGWIVNVAFLASILNGNPLNITTKTFQSAESWYNLIKANFENAFYVKPLYSKKANQKTIGPQFFAAIVIAPDLFDKDYAEVALEEALAYMKGDIGIKIDNTTDDLFYALYYLRAFFKLGKTWNDEQQMMFNKICHHATCQQYGVIGISVSDKNADAMCAALLVEAFDDYRLSKMPNVPHYPTLVQQEPPLKIEEEPPLKIEEPPPDYDDLPVAYPVIDQERKKIRLIPIPPNFDQISIYNIAINSLDQFHETGVVFEEGNKKVLEVTDEDQKKYAMKTLISFNDTMSGIQNAASINHCCVTKLYKFYSAAENVTIITELMNCSLEKLIERMRSGEIYLTDSQKGIIVLGIALGMRWIHAKGLIHLGLKPSNIMLDENFEPKIADLGLAREDLMQSPFCSSMRYIAPEIDEPEYTNKVDVYSFGLIINELFTLERAFGKRTERKAVFAALNGERPDLAPECKYNSLIQRCWSQDPKARPSFQEIAQEICNSLSKEEADYVVKVQKFELKNAFSREELEDMLIEMSCESCN